MVLKQRREPQTEDTGKPKEHVHAKGNHQRKPLRSSTVLWISGAAVAVVVALLVAHQQKHGSPKIGTLQPSVARQPAQETAAASWKCPKGDRQLFEALVEKLTKEHGALLSNVELDYWNGVRGLKVTKDIPQDGLVLAIPYDAALSIATMSASAEAARATLSWSRVEDGDIHLDTLALLYEALVMGNRSPWALHLCSMPASYDLPVTNREAWSERIMDSIPELRRLVDKRRDQLRQYEKMTHEALVKLPGAEGRPPFPVDAEFKKNHTWAYLATKTRTMSVDMEEIKHHGHPLPMAPELSWLSELGLLVPVLDLVNHAALDNATTAFTVDFTLPGSKPVGTRGARKPVFALRALQNLQKGEQVTFSYMYEQESDPHCNYRWLAEYGMVILDGNPYRDCYAFNVTLNDFIQHLAKVENFTDQPDRIEQEKSIIIQKLRERDENMTTVALLTSGEESQALLGPLSAWAFKALNGVEDRAAAAVCGILREQLEKLASSLSTALAAPEAQKIKGQVTHSGVYPSGVWVRTATATGRAAYLEVLRGAVRAVVNGIEAVRCGAEFTDGLDLPRMLACQDAASASNSLGSAGEGQQAGSCQGAGECGWS